MLTDDDLRALREALDAGPTPGPWADTGEVIKEGEPLFVATMARTGPERTTGKRH